MEETTVNFPSQSVHVNIWDSGVPKTDLMAFWLVSGFREEVQLIPQVQSGHCVSTRNRPGRSCCCCCHDSFNKKEHFEPLWLGLSNKSKHGQLLIDYIFREHVFTDGCLYLVIHCLATTGQAIAYILFDSNCSCSIHFRLNITTSPFHHRTVAHYFQNTSGRGSFQILYLD